MHDFGVFGQRELMGEEQAQRNSVGLDRPCLTQTLPLPDQSVICCHATRTTEGAMHMLGTTLETRASQSLPDAAAVKLRTSATSRSVPWSSVSPPEISAADAMMRVYI